MTCAIFEHGSVYESEGVATMAKICRDRITNRKRKEHAEPGETDQSTKTASRHG